MPNGNNSSPVAQLFLPEETRQILRKSALCSKLSDDQAAYFFEVCERTKLDPFTGMIRPDIRKRKLEDGSYEPVMLIITTLQGLRGIGDRSGLLDGESEIEWTGVNGEWHNAWLPKEPPIAARASIYRKDRTHPQTEIVRWDAFCQFVYNKKGEPVPNAFWDRMGSHMLGKCARAAGYRGAFPNLCSNLYITEEIHEELDKDSEEAIEAEMTRRARADKTYWEEENKKGNFSIDQQQQREKGEIASMGTSPKLTDRKVAQTEKTGAELFAGARTAPLPAPLPSEATTLPSEETTSPTNLIDMGGWQNFVITRIQLFKGRTVASLTKNEMDGLQGLMEKLKASWGGLDEDFKNHFNAIQARMDDDYQKELDKMAAGDFQLT